MIRNKWRYKIVFDTTKPTYTSIQASWWSTWILENVLSNFTTVSPYNRLSVSSNVWNKKWKH